MAIPGELRSQCVGKIQYDEVRLVTTPLTGHFTYPLSIVHNKPKEEEEMSRVSYASAVRSLMYAMICIRPDLAYAVSTVSQFMSNPRKQYWEAVNWVLQYLQGTVRLGLAFQRLKMGKPKVLQGYVDADSVEDLDQ